MSNLNLQVGGTYRDASGEIVKIVANGGFKPYPFNGDNGRTYTTDGRWARDPEGTEFDLVEEFPATDPNVSDSYTDTIDAAMCIWEWVWSEADEEERQKYHALMEGDSCGWAYVREETFEEVAPALDAAFQATTDDQRFSEGMHSFDWEFVPSYMRAMVRLELGPTELKDRQDEILADMGLGPEKNVTQIEIDLVETEKGLMYGVYLRVNEQEGGTAGPYLAEHVEDYTTHTLAYTKAMRLAEEHEVKIVDTTKTGLKREVDPEELAKEHAGEIRAKAQEIVG